MPFTLATWNINSVRLREPLVCQFLEEEGPDVLCLQECKSPVDKIPRERFTELGYTHMVARGQKGYNGVAILSKLPLEDVTRGLPGDDADEQARWIEATVVGDSQAVRICGLYLPNGNPHPGPKFDYKLAWMEKLRERTRQIWDEEVPAVVLGDFNVIPEDKDVWSVRAMADDALMQPESRDHYARFLSDGWTDAIDTLNPRGGVWTFWDYQAGAWQRDHGFRIDHLLLSPELADRMTAAGVDKAYRGREKSSDHTPVWVDLRD